VAQFCHTLKKVRGRTFDQRRTSCCRKVDIVATACEDLRGIARLRRTIPTLRLREIKARLGRSTPPARTLVSR